MSAGRTQNLSDQGEGHLSPKLFWPSQMGVLLSWAWLVVNKGTKFDVIAEANMCEGCPVSVLMGRE